MVLTQHCPACVEHKLEILSLVENEVATSNEQQHGQWVDVVEASTVLRQELPKVVDEGQSHLAHPT